MMLDQENPIIRAFLKQGYKVSVQAHLAKDKSPRYTAIARHGDGRRAQGWGADAADAIRDLNERPRNCGSDAKRVQ